MLDWLASKVSMTIAAMVLLTSAAGFFAWLHADTSRRSLAAVAENLAAFLDAVSSVRGDATFVLSFGSGIGHVLPNQIDGALYELEIGRSAVVLTRGATVAFAVLGIPVHLFRPSARTFSSVELASLDDDHPRIRVHSSGRLDVLRVSVEIEGQRTFATFVALPLS